MAICVLTGGSASGQETFFDAYELGLAHERAGRWSQARDALDLAIELRPQAGRDVPTFGRDRLAVYDPYLHLAQVEIELGDLRDAAEHLAAAASAGVSAVAEIDAVAARIGAPPSGRAEPTPTPRATFAPPPTPVVPKAAPRATLPPTVVPEPTAADGQPSPSAGATVEVTGEGGAGRGKGGGGPLLLLLVAAAFVAGAVFLARRKRRSAPTPEPPPVPKDFDTTPTRRVDTSSGAASVVEPAPALSPDEGAAQIGDYRLVDVLGRGGMATTYRARQVSDGQIVALKVPHQHLLDDEEFVNRFLREGSLGATIHHPNIIRIFEAGRHGRTPFIAMELVDGVTLETRLKDGGPLAVRETLEIVRGIALALDYAHVKGVVHRDVKPDNVMLLKDGSVKVMDFGIAHVATAPGLTATNIYLGTPLYSPPEAIEPAEVGPQSDLYSLGIVTYRMLANEIPFKARSPFKIVELHRTQPLPRLSRELGVSPRVEAMVRRLAAKRKEDRYPSAEAFLHDLNQYLAGKTKA